MTDITKSRNFELLCEILGLAIETKTEFQLYPYNFEVDWQLRLDDGNKYMRYTLNLDVPSPDLEKAKQDLLNYKFKGESK